MSFLPWDFSETITYQPAPLWCSLGIHQEINATMCVHLNAYMVCVCVFSCSYVCASVCVYMWKPEVNAESFSG